MKNFPLSTLRNISVSTILGLVFGISLVAYGVFAFEAPTAAPPGGNVEAPVNVGPDSQVKSGGLWVNTLGTDGGVSIGGSLTVSGQTVCLGNGTNCPPGVPAGFVGFFNLGSCPSGWSELTGARGRYLVGLPSGGTLGGTAGTDLSNLENRPVGQHNHTISDPGHDHGGYNQGRNDPEQPWYAQELGSGDAEGYPPDTGDSGTGITINNAGSVAGTNAPYIQFLACQKS